jgi:hypothetical protein
MPRSIFTPALSNPHDNPPQPQNKSIAL